MDRGRGYPRAAASLRACAEEVLAAWEREVRELRGLPEGEPPSPVLRDDVPEMLAALADALEPPAEAGPISDRSPYDHALQRFAEDVPLETLVAEYRVLRTELFRLVARQAPDELPGAWPAIAEHLDRAIQEAVARYSEQRTRWLREREQELETLIEHLPIGVVVAEAPSRRIVRTNREMARIQAGIEDAQTVEEAAAGGVERLDGTPWSPGDLPLVRALAGAEAGPEEVRITAPGGRPIVAEVRATPLVDERGDVRAAVAIAADVTERVRLRAERKLFAETLGHDVKSPLSTIRIAAQRLEKLDVSNTARKLAGGIARSSARLADLFDELLELAKRWEGPIEVHRERIDLASLCREVVADRRAGAGGGDVRLDAPEPVVGDWDRQRLVRIAENLLDNAGKYREPGTAIDVRVAREGEAAVLSVSNRGEPIPANMGGRLFEPYSRGEGSRGAGSGLGLYIVKEFVDAHGGKVEVQSGQSRTTFRVLLPLAGDRLAI